MPRHPPCALHSLPNKPNTTHKQTISSDTTLGYTNTTKQLIPHTTHPEHNPTHHPAKGEEEEDRPGPGPAMRGRCSRPLCTTQTTNPTTPTHPPTRGTGTGSRPSTKPPHTTPPPSRPSRPSPPVSRTPPSPLHSRREKEPAHERTPPNRTTQRKGVLCLVSQTPNSAPPPPPPPPAHTHRTRASQEEQEYPGVLPMVPLYEHHSRRDTTTVPRG